MVVDAGWRAGENRRRAPNRRIDPLLEEITRMNPNELVETIRVEVSNYRAAMTNSDHLLAAEELVDAIEVLDGWLKHGGGLPDQWKQVQRIGA
jgi:hypothetical protein